VSRSSPAPRGFRGTPTVSRVGQNTSDGRHFTSFAGSVQRTELRCSLKGIRPSCEVPHPPTSFSPCGSLDRCGNPLPDRHARPKHSMQRVGSRILLLPATVFLLTGYGSALQNSLAIPPARSQRLETTFRSPATTVPLREPPRRGQRSRPISSTKF